MRCNFQRAVLAIPLLYVYLEVYHAFTREAYERKMEKGIYPSICCPLDSLKENLPEGGSLRNYPILYCRDSQAVTSVPLSSPVQQWTIKFYITFHRAGCFHHCRSYLENDIGQPLTSHIQSLITSPLQPIESSRISVYLRTCPQLVKINEAFYKVQC